jgi:hypothetical protein
MGQYTVEIDDKLLIDGDDNKYKPVAVRIPETDELYIANTGNGGIIICTDSKTYYDYRIIVEKIERKKIWLLRRLNGGDLFDKITLPESVDPVTNNNVVEAYCVGYEE